MIASRILVPSPIVGFYGQNFESALSEGSWAIGVSAGLIVVSTIVQVVLFRWRRRI